MNAEIFEKKEYADSVARVDFARVCDLIVGDRFMWQGTWFKVYKITKDKIYYNHHSASYGTRGSNSFGAKSQMFVQIVKK